MAVWLKIAGSKNVENDAVGYASTHTDMNGKPLCTETGGVYPRKIPEIWNAFGIPVESDSSKNLERIAQAIESGRAVSVGVNAGKLWEQDNMEGYNLNDPENNCYADGSSNHEIGVVSVARDPITGSITHFFINDTGRGLLRDACRKISVQDFWNAFNVPDATAIISKRPVW